VVLAILRIKSFGQRSAEVIQALRLLMRSARAEKGFIGANLQLDTDDVNLISYEERWQTREDFEEQARTPRYARLLALMESAAEQPSLEFHFVSETRDLDYVASVRGEKASPTNQLQHQRKRKNI
jgi:quinol monooxygenase YgiN